MSLNSLVLMIGPHLGMKCGGSGPSGFILGILRSPRLMNAINSAFV